MKKRICWPLKQSSLPSYPLVVHGGVLIGDTVIFIAPRKLTYFLNINTSFWNGPFLGGGLKKTFIFGEAPTPAGDLRVATGNREVQIVKPPPKKTLDFLGTFNFGLGPVKGLVFIYIYIYRYWILQRIAKLMTLSVSLSRYCTTVNSDDWEGTLQLKRLRWDILSNTYIYNYNTYHIHLIFKIIHKYIYVYINIYTYMYEYQYIYIYISLFDWPGWTVICRT